MLFKDIIGQQEIKQKLLKLVGEDRAPHALMLLGSPGTGKLALAVAMARYLACTGRGQNDACGTCPSCVKFNKLVHPDLHFVLPVMTTSKVSKDPETDLFMEEWREAFLANPYLSEHQWYEAIGAENKQGIINVRESESLIRKLGFKPYESDFRMVIIWLPEKMNQQASNKLLKHLEEPPPGTLILMVSENTDPILPTILSRTQLVMVPPLDKNWIREGLREKGVTDPGLLEDAVRQARGNFNTALTVLAMEGQELHYFDLFTGLMRLCYTRKIVEINDWVEEVAGIGRERQKQLLDYALRLLRESFMLHMAREELSFMSAKEAEFTRKFSPFIHQGNIHELVEQFTLAGNHVQANGNPRIVFMDLSIRVIRLLMQK